MVINTNLSIPNANLSFDTIAPYSYNEWLTRNSSVAFEESVELYNSYITQWYQYSNANNIQSVDAVKQEYINLFKELTYFFTEEEKNIFLKDIDFNNDIELISAIPYFVQKLKEIALTIAKKRETIKNSKLKFAATGSSHGIENILYEYILKSHTATSKTTQLAISSLGITFPELSAVKDDFFIEIEETYDTGSYADFDIAADNNYDIASYVVNIPSIANNSLFAIFKTFLADQLADSIPLSGYEAYNNTDTPNILNLSKLNIKYLGNTLYGITAIKNDITLPVNSVAMNISPGNNWFYWPSGETFTDINIIENTYEPIPLSSTAINFVLSGATAGSSYTNSDLFFIETRNLIEGAWLKGSTTAETSGNMVATIPPGEIRSFIFPKPGYGLTSTYKWSGRILDDESLTTFNLLDPAIREQIIKKYLTAGKETDIATPLYINRSNIVNCGAKAANNSLEADSILVRPGGPFNDINQTSSVGIYNDPNLTREAFLYKLTSTELPIDSGEYTILWPLTATSTTNTDFSHIYVSPDTCNDVYLGAIDVNKTMIGAVGGRTPDESDILYKITAPGGKVIEAAWLSTGSVKSLATYNTYSIPVYDAPAVNCITQPDGPIQPNLNFIAAGGEKVSFIWCDVDTPADEVFKYIPHAADCPYIKTNHNYVKNTTVNWNSCTCKSINYSPIGHTGSSLTDYNGSADYLFADPQGLGANFTLTQWRDTRNFNFKTSPQFSYFKKKDNSIDTVLGFGPGAWQTGNGSKMILKTGRQYTYVRNSLEHLNIKNTAPSLIARYAYNNIINSVKSDISSDIVIAVDISGSQYFSIEKTKQLLFQIIEYANLSAGSQLSIVLFSKESATASYLYTDKEKLINIVKLIQIPNTAATSNLTDGIQVSHKILTNIFGGSGNSLATLCSNLEVYASTPFSLAGTTNIPSINNKKVIVIISDGAENLFVNKAILAANKAKEHSIKIISVDIGPNSTTNNLMERIATSTSDYYNYEEALLQEDSNSAVNTIANSIISNIYGGVSIQPVWRKGEYKDGLVALTYDVSDMVIRPGDFLKYLHRQTVTYTSFTTTGAPFVINIPLYGWNYNTNSYDGVSLGAKPYWGSMLNSSTVGAESERFFREFGGHIRYFKDYIPISHPHISNILLNSSDYIEYRNKDCKSLVWKENIQFTTTIQDSTWCKLKVCIQDAPLKELFKNSTIDKIFEQTDEVSDIVLATHGAGSFSPAYYCYYALNSFVISQPLSIKTTTQTFSQILTGVVIDPIYPHLNLTNTHYASIAFKPNKNNLITKEETGHFLLPSMIGVPYFLGLGATNTLNTNKLSTWKGDIVFANPAMYTSNRGLTKKDQASPYETTHVDNTWIKEQHTAGNKSGLIINAASYQKFVPYHTNYETLKHNNYGLSRQDDSFEFWSGPNNNIWNEETLYPSNYKKEPYKIQERTDNLLVTDKNIAVWQTDIYGNNYGILKNTSTIAIADTKLATGELWVRDVYNNISPGRIALSGILNNFINNSEHLIELASNSVQDIQIFEDIILLKTVSGLSLSKVVYDFTTGEFNPQNNATNIINTITPLNYVSDSWYIEKEKSIYICSLQHRSTDKNTIDCTLYRYNLKTDLFTATVKDSISFSANILEHYAIKQPISLTYNEDTQTFLMTVVLVGSKLILIEIKNLKDNPYILSVTVGV